MTNKELEEQQKCGSFPAKGKSVCSSVIEEKITQTSVFFTPVLDNLERSFTEKKTLFSVV